MSIPPPPPSPGPDEPTSGSASLVSPSIHDARMLAARVPVELLPLARLAYNYWWSWQPEGDSLFRSVDPERWVHCGHNPVRLLFESPRLAQAARRPDLIARAHAFEEAMRADLARPFAAAPPASPTNPVAFFCAEFAIHSSLPIYSGGLGVLAGDFLKESSDRALPLVGVGLLYHLGFFHQRLDLTGWQHESWTRSAPEYLGLTLCTGTHGTPLRFRVSLRGHDVTVGVWRADVGRVPLYLLDTDLPENAPVDRFITSQLYVGDRDFRLMQYALLGIGGIRALAALGIDPGVVHLNEGHAALSCLELARPAIEGGTPPLEALAEVQKRVVFTTHTPVAAGNESYRPEEVQRILPDLHTRLGIEMRQLLDLGRSAGADPERPFGMTVFALRTSRRANGVSRKHGEVSRGMWQGLWPERAVEDVPITHVTNGVHLRTWMAAPMRALLDRHLGPRWIDHACDPVVWDAIDGIPDEELWAVRNQMRTMLVNYVRQRSVGDRLLRGEPLEYVEGAARTFDPAVLTIGFARRVTGYKRLNLLVHDPVRALALLSGPRPIQVVMAGNSHPRDEEGKRLIQRIFELKSEPSVNARVVFLEDYETRTAQMLVAGCDVWVNVPRPPFEASGTSGMKAGMNGNLNLSVLDGWWCEGHMGGDADGNGWAIHSDPALDHATQDARDADRLYSLLSTEVVPMFHDRDAGGLPRRWLQRVKASLRSLPPQFNAGRMVSDYLLRIYRGA